MADIKFPDVEVELSDTDSNVFSIIGKVKKALKRAGHHEAAQEFSDEAMRQESYDDVIQLAMRTVDVS